MIQDKKEKEPNFSATSWRYPLKNRILTVSYYSNYNSKETPFIRLQGKWLEEAGFKIGDKIEVREQQEELVIRVVKDNP